MVKTSRTTLFQYPNDKSHPSVAKRKVSVKIILFTGKWRIGQNLLTLNSGSRVGLSPLITYRFHIGEFNFTPNRLQQIAVVTQEIWIAQYKKATIFIYPELLKNKLAATALKLNTICFNFHECRSACFHQKTGLYARYLSFINVFPLPSAFTNPIKLFDSSWMLNRWLRAW